MLAAPPLKKAKTLHLSQQTLSRISIWFYLSCDAAQFVFYLWALCQLILIPRSWEFILALGALRSPQEPSGTLRSPQEPLAYIFNALGTWHDCCTRTQRCFLWFGQHWHFPRGQGQIVVWLITDEVHCDFETTHHQTSLMHQLYQTPLHVGRQSWEGIQTTNQTMFWAGSVESKCPYGMRWKWHCPGAVGWITAVLPTLSLQCALMYLSWTLQSARAHCTCLSKLKEKGTHVC